MIVRQKQTVLAYNVSLISCLTPTYHLNYVTYFFFAPTFGAAAKLWSCAVSFKLRSNDSALKKTRLFEFARVEAMSRAASILRRVMKEGLLAMASPISCALFASPWNMAQSTYTLGITQLDVYSG